MGHETVVNENESIEVVYTLLRVRQVILIFHRKDSIQQVSFLFVEEDGKMNCIFFRAFVMLYTSFSRLLIYSIENAKIMLSPLFKQLTVRHISYPLLIFIKWLLKKIILIKDQTQTKRKSLKNSLRMLQHWQNVYLW